jgi:hypothetical protein
MESNHTIKFSAVVVWSYEAVVGERQQPLALTKKIKVNIII